MNRRSAVRLMMAAGAGSLVTGRLPGDDDLLIRSEVRLVLLDVSVTNHQGGPVPGLTRENFRIFEDGRPQQITVFDHGDLPVTVGILVDESRSMTAKRPAVITAALTFIAESNPLDEVFVLNFNEKVTAGLPSPQLFSDNREDLRAALFSGVPAGRTALYDAVVAGMDQLGLGMRDKKTLVVISDGGDNASRATRHETLNRIERGIATIYSVGLFDTEDPDRDPAILREFAKISGGEAYFPDKLTEMVPICRRIAHDIRTRYTVGYLPQAGKDLRGVRHIRVDASGGGHSSLTVRTRSSYRYESENPKGK